MKTFKLIKNVLILNPRWTIFYFTIIVVIPCFIQLQLCKFFHTVFIVVILFLIPFLCVCPLQICDIYEVLHRELFKKKSVILIKQTWGVERLGWLLSLEGRTCLIIELVRVKLPSRFLSLQSCCVIETLSQDYGELKDCDQSAAYHATFHHVQWTTLTWDICRGFTDLWCKPGQGDGNIYLFRSLYSKLIFRIMFLVVYRYRSLPFILQIQINKHYMLLILTNLKRLEYSHTNYFSNV